MTWDLGTEADCLRFFRRVSPGPGRTVRGR